MDLPSCSQTWLEHLLFFADFPSSTPQFFMESKEFSVCLISPMKIWSLWGPTKPTISLASTCFIFSTNIFDFLICVIPGLTAPRTLTIQLRITFSTGRLCWQWQYPQSAPASHWPDVTLCDPVDRSGFFWNHLRKQLTCLLAFKSTVAFFEKQHYCIHYCYLLHLRYWKLKLTI